jgi:hypothetical protein
MFSKLLQTKPTLLWADKKKGKNFPSFLSKKLPAIIQEEATKSRE